MLDADEDRCPQCGEEVTWGYGCAGGGMGFYVFCTDEHCDYFHKIQDVEEEDDREKTS